MKAPQRSFQNRLFWRLLLAFCLIIFIVGGGVLLVSLFAFGGSFISSGDTQLMQLWIDRLSGYYDRHGGWQDVGSMLAEYPAGSDWEPWDSLWQLDFVLIGADGTIVAASDPSRIGQQPNTSEQLLAAPIQKDDRKVGSLLILSREQIGARFGPGRVWVICLVIACVGLLISVVFSRRLLQPLGELTAATQSLAAGNLGVRISTLYKGEAGELVAAFNQMAEKLAQADEQRRNLTADVAHELRTPLSIVRAKLEGVLDGVYPATPEHLEPVLETVTLLSNLVEDLRLLALAEAHQLTLERQPVEIGDLLHDTQVNFGPQAADRGVEIALDVSPDLPRVMADRRRIAQVMGNLMTNALRHTPKDGVITLKASRTVGGMMEIAVTDTGQGIPPEDLPFLFERFWRGEKSRSRTSGGSGLGLAIARQLVEMHSGKISAESTPGEGSTFRFTLPLV